MSEPDGTAVLIRRVTDRDLNACFETEGRSFPPAEAASRENIARRIELFPEGFLVAELGGKVVGHINSGATDKEDITDEEFKALIGHDSAGANIVVFSLAVLPEFRGRHIGRQLMLKFVEKSRRLGKKRVMLICNEGLIAYYASLGFRYAGVSSSTHGGSAWHEMYLSLDS